MAWGKNGTTTLVGAGDDLDIDNFTATKFMQISSHSLDTGGTTRQLLTFNNDTGSDYSHRNSDDGASGINSTNQGDIDYWTSTFADEKFVVSYLINIATEEKLMITFIMQSNTAGAGTAPSRRKQVSKYVETTNQITDIDINNTGTGSYDTDSNLSVIGTD